MKEEFGYEVIDASAYGVVSSFGEEMVSIPLSIVRENRSLYFHCAVTGEKVSAFSSHPKVKAVFVSHAKVPQLFSKEEIEKEVAEGHFSFLGLNVYTTEFSSAIAEGTITEVTDEREMRHALMLLCQKYTPDSLEWVDLAMEHGIKRLKIYRIDMEKLTAKRKMFDQSRRECKGDYPQTKQDRKMVEQ